MKNYQYIALLVTLAFCMILASPAISLAGDEDNGLSIQQALDIAYKSNPDIRKAQLEVDKAQLQRDDAAEAVTFIPTGGLVAPAYQQLYNGYQQTEIALKTAKKACDAEKDRITKEVIAAYATAIKNYNIMETTRLNLEDMKEQKKAYSLAKEVGYMAEHDYSKFETGLKSLEEGYKASQAQYNSSIASLGQLLGKTQGWNPELTSRAVLDEYSRNELTVEISRALSESVLVMRQQALLDIEESKQEWVLPNVSSDMQQIELDMAGINYEQARRSARSTIEGLYYGIDALEGQIEAAQSSYEMARRNYEVAKLKYEVGMIPKCSIVPGEESLNGAALDVSKKLVELESLKADLAQNKATFAYLTGQVVYSSGDWKIFAE